MKLFTAKCHERGTLRKLWRQTGNSWLLPAKCWPLLHVIRACSWRGPDVVAGISANFSKFAFVFIKLFLLYNKSLNDWSLGQQWILFPSNLNVSLDFVSGNIEILGKQNSLFPSGPVIKCMFPRSMMEACFIISLIYHEYIPWCFFDLRSIYAKVLPWSIMDVYQSISIPLYWICGLVFPSSIMDICLNVFLV